MPNPQAPMSTVYNWLLDTYLQPLSTPAGRLLHLQPKDTWRQETLKHGNNKWLPEIRNATPSR
jgi:hypothetical protein